MLDKFSSNEITRLIARRLEARASHLFAPAMPGEGLVKTLRADPAIQRVLRLWPKARCVLMGVGAAPLIRSEMPAFVPMVSDSLREAVGDVCSRFFDRDGAAIAFPGSERLMAVELGELKRVPVGIAVAAGADKVEPITVGARAGLFNQLVTDPLTAEQILAQA